MVQVSFDDVVAYHESFTSGLPKPITPVRQFDSVGVTAAELNAASVDDAWVSDLDGS